MTGGGENSYAGVAHNVHIPSYKFHVLSQPDASLCVSISRLYFDSMFCFPSPRLTETVTNRVPDGEEDGGQDEPILGADLPDDEVSRIEPHGHKAGCDRGGYYCAYHDADCRGVPFISVLLHSFSSLLFDCSPPHANDGPRRNCRPWCLWSEQVDGCSGGGRLPFSLLFTIFMKTKLAGK